MSEQQPKNLKITVFFNLLTLLLLLFSPFLASGDWTWSLGWLYTGSMILYTILSRAIAIRLHPGFARERATASAMQDTKRWDRWIVPLVALWLPLLAVGIAGLDERLGWTAGLPGWVHWLGLGLLTFGYTIGTWAMAVNAFFSSHVRIQKDRGQTVISTGPYAIVRHPAYITGAVAMCGLPLLLDSLLAFPPVILLCMGIVLRTALEDKTLLAELPGYKEYAQKVRFRLIPGLW
ncbi:MAG: isoprenylcysteine carboxylmethyltransferase family protein [Syntrophobacteraceae bacterium]|nr:isoprenylcysteine carboxylmethyltransferase family protein [Syntrophobacteraceae bacterium]